jgi:hypothetical protein
VKTELAEGNGSQVWKIGFVETLLPMSYLENVSLVNTISLKNQEDFHKVENQ